MFGPKFEKLSLTLLALTASWACAAGESPCNNPADTVKQLPPKNATTIAHHFWESGRDKDSNEHLKTLYLFFKNGDYAVIQHKYCSMYNFDIAFFRSGQADKLNVADVAKIVTGLYESYAAKKVTFKRPLADIISTSLKERGFDRDKTISVGLPDDEIQHVNQRVDYSVGYTSLYMSTDIYSSVSTFYLGIGGAH